MRILETSQRHLGALPLGNLPRHPAEYGNLLKELIARVEAVLRRTFRPDLVRRLREGRELAPFERRTLYTAGREGYADYPPLE